MLPDFPSIRKLLDESVALNLRQSARKKSVIDTLVRGATQHEGRIHSFHQEGTGTVHSGYSVFQAGVEVKFEDVPNLTGDKLQEKLDEISSQMAKKTSDRFYQVMDKVTTQSGNRIDAGEKGLTKENALKMLRMTMWSPDSVFIAHPDMAESMRRSWQEWQEDREFMRAYEELSSEKKEEWRARESNRKLVG